MTAEELDGALIVKLKDNTIYKLHNKFSKDNINLAIKDCFVLYGFRYSEEQKVLENFLNLSVEKVISKEENPEYFL